MTTIVREIKPEQVKGGMVVRYVATHPSHTVTVEGPVTSVGNRTTLLIGETYDYTEADLRIGDAEVKIFEVIELPEKQWSMILVKDGTIEAPLYLNSNDLWEDLEGNIIDNSELPGRFVRILWEPES